jgi:CubicO group peptidase (beta-lactamase class C family)
VSKLQKAFEQLDQFVEQKMAATRTPGAAIALTDRENNLHVSTYGVADRETGIPVTPDTLFEIGSIGKSFTAVAVLQAHQAKLLDIQAAITDYLPWFQVRSAYDPITIHYLLTHSSGLIRGTEFSPDPRSMVWALRETDAAFPPGERCHYSDVGYKILGLVLQQVRGQSYTDVIQTHILDPLGMTASEPAISHAIRPRLATGYRHLYDDRPSHTSHPLVPVVWLETDSGDGSIASTAEDMAKYVRMLLNRGQGPHGPILSEEDYNRMTQPWIDGDYWIWGHYGYGLYVFEEGGFAHVGHGGDMPGYEAYITADLDNGLGTVVLVTQPYPAGLIWGVVRQFRSAYLDGTASASAISSPADPARVAKPADFAGTFRGGDKTLILTATGERLLLNLDAEQVTLEARGRDRFYVNHPEFDRYLLQFGRTDTSAAHAVVVEAFYGPDWYTNDRYSGQKVFEYPQAWHAFAGHYRSFNPWESNFRVIVRKGQLLLVWPAGDEETLIPLAPAEFRVGEDFSPERLRFDQVVNGQALRANLSNCDYYRCFTP